MTQPVIARPIGGTRAKLFLSIVLLGVMFVVGYQFVDPRESRRVFSAVAAITGIIAGIVPVLGRHKRRLQHWFLLASFAAMAVAIGMLMRMTFHRG